jgi:phenylalanyl-tRNA synthetase alpha chain
MSTKRKILTIADPGTPTIPQNLRIKQLLALPDLSKTEGSPIKFLIDAVVKIRRFENFDIVNVPEIVSVRNEFDLLNTPIDHPSRRETDTYFLEKNWVLRTQTTVMWPYYLSAENIKKLETKEEIGALCYGKVYRKDEIDRSHYPVFHQVDGLYLCRKDKKIIGIPELTEVLVDIVKNIYGAEVKYQISEDTFPFTNPSIQIAIKWGNQWLEVVGAGAVHTEVLKNLSINPSVYNGWAFGFGLERLAMIKMEIPDIRIFWSTDKRITGQFKDLNSRFQEVSKYPMTYRDISFVIDKNTNLNNYYEIIRDCAGDLVEEVSLLDKYENKEKFGENNISYTFRIVYRSHERTLINKEIDEIMSKITSGIQNQYQAKIR